eukprot:5489174-Pleurochrysis_carterae.AAC.2
MNKSGTSCWPKRQSASAPRRSLRCRLQLRALQCGGSDRPWDWRGAWRSSDWERRAWRQSRVARAAVAAKR